MTVRSVQWVDSTGKTLYWFPDASLATWNTNRVQAVERSAPNLGIYDASLDDTISDDWYLFEGATQPTSWSLFVSSLQLNDDTSDTPSIQWVDTSGKTLYWYPDQSLSDWTTYRVAAIERSAPNLGMYDATLDGTLSQDWYLFEGLSQPSSWDDAITNIELGIRTAPEEPSGGNIGLLTYTFTSQSEIERLYSTEGMNNRRDDFETGDVDYTNTLNEIIDFATLEVKAIVNKLFDDIDLYDNLWVRRRATVIACYLLSIRRGNPSQYFNEYLDALADLERLVAGELYFDDLPVGTSARVAMVNVSSDNRSVAMPIRVDPITSTTTDNADFVKWYIPYYWL